MSNKIRFVIIVSNNEVEVLFFISYFSILLMVPFCNISKINEVLTENSRTIRFCCETDESVYYFI